MTVARIFSFCSLSLAVFLAGCALFDDSLSKRPSNTGLIATPVTYYSTSRARYLGTKYKDNLDRLVEKVARNAKTSSLQFANNISSVGGIGFYTHSVTKTADERFLELVLAVPETFDAKGTHSDQVNRLFNLYGPELLAILTSESDIYQDKELSGYGLNLAWRNLVSEATGTRVVLERAIIYLSKERSRGFLRREISQNDLLADATIFAVKEDGPLNLVSYRAPEVRQESAPAIREDDIAPAAPEATPTRLPATTSEPVAKVAPPKPPVTVAQKTKPLPLKPAPEPVAKPAPAKTPAAAPVEIARLEKPVMSTTAVPEIKAPAPRVESVMPISPAKSIEMPTPMAVLDAQPAPELKTSSPAAPPPVEAPAAAPIALKPISPAPPVSAEVAVKPLPAVMTAPVARVETKAAEVVVVPPAPVKAMPPETPPVAANTKPAVTQAPALPVVPTPTPPVETKAVEIASVPAAVTRPLAIELPLAQPAAQSVPAPIVLVPRQPTGEPSLPAPALASAAKPAAEQLALLTTKPPEAAPIKPVIARPVTPRALEGFIIQLAFNDKDRAQRWAEGMEKKGFAVSVTEAGNEGALRVRVGNFTARDDAERQLRAIKQDGLNGIILNLPQGFRPEARSSIP